MDTERGRKEPSSVARRWGVRPGLRIWFGGHNLSAKRAADPHLTGTCRPASGPVERGFIAPQTVDEAVHFAGKLRDRLTDGGAIWILSPRPAAPGTGVCALDLSRFAERLGQHGFAAYDTVSVDDHHLSSCFRTVRPQGD